MNLTLGQIKSAESALKKLLNTDLPIAIAFKLGKLAKDIDAELVQYEEQRNKLVVKYGKEDEEGNTTVEPSKIKEFMAEIVELNSVSISIPFDPISVTKLDGAKMTAVDMAALEPFIEE